MISQNSIYLLLGSNLGDRERVMEDARESIQSEIGIPDLLSHLYETAPWGILNQPSFLNQVVKIMTLLEPGAVLKAILEIEQALGRVRNQRWGARIIDIDLLYYNDLILNSASLTVPHPRLHERRFTLAPLAEIAPTLTHPIYLKTSSQLLSECIDMSEVKVFSRNSSIDKLSGQI